jgi:hypothetical protein
VKIQNSASKTTCEIDVKNWIEEQFISSQAFHRITGGHVQKITAVERFKPRNLESLDPMTQELYRYLPAMIPTKTYNKSHLNQVLFKEQELTVKK